MKTSWQVRVLILLPIGLILNGARAGATDAPAPSPLKLSCLIGGLTVTNEPLDQAEVEIPLSAPNGDLDLRVGTFPGWITQVGSVRIPLAHDHVVSIAARVEAYSSPEKKFVDGISLRVALLSKASTGSSAEALGFMLAEVAGSDDNSPLQTFFQLLNTQIATQAFAAGLDPIENYYSAIGTLLERNQISPHTAREVNVRCLAEVN